MNVGAGMGRRNKRFKVDRRMNGKDERGGGQRRQTVRSFYLHQSAVLGPVTSSRDGRNMSLWRICQGRAEGPWTQALFSHSNGSFSAVGTGA